MKRVVIVAPDFAPSSLPPALRVRFFANNLRQFGWEPIVLTTKPEFYDWNVDPENYQLVDESVEVVRTNAWRTSWTRKLGVGDVGIRSLVFQWQSLKSLCKGRNVDLIFIPVPPSVSMTLGRLAFHKFGIPYVIDYIDPWVTDYYWRVPKEQRPPKWALAYTMARILEPFALKHVAHVTGVSQGTTDSVINRYEHLSPSAASEIPYGADAADFAHVRTHPRVNPIFNPGDGHLHMSYVGACIPGMHPTVKEIFRAIRLGLDSQPELFTKLRLHFVGTSYAQNGVPQIDAIAREFGIQDFVDERTARVSYLESLQIMLDSDVLFLIGSGEPHYSASKVFPYMLARKPLLAVFHEDSSVVKILDDIGHATVVTFRDQQSLENDSDNILNALRSILSGRPGPTEIEPEQFDRFTTKAMTARLATAFDRALNHRQQLKTFVAADERQGNIPLA